MNITALCIGEHWSVCSSHISAALGSTTAVFIFTNSHQHSGAQQYPSPYAGGQTGPHQTGPLAGVPSHCQTIGAPGAYAMTAPGITPSTLEQQQGEYRPVFQHQAGVDY